MVIIIDSHTHIGAVFGGRRINAGVLAEEIKNAGVDAALVFAFELPVENSKNSVIATEEVMKETTSYPNLFAIGTASPFTLNDERLNELKSWLETDKIKAVKLYPGYEHFYPGDERLRPLYEICARLGKPVIFHSGCFYDPDKVGLIKYARPLFIDDVAAGFPSLKIVIAHLGNPWIADCAAVVQKNENVYADASGYFTEFRKISKEEIKQFKEDLKIFHKIAGSYKKLIFGSDWPLYELKEYVEAAKKLPLSPEEKELFFWKNAADIFNLPTGK